MKKIILVGASGFGKEVAWLIERINSENQIWEVLGFLDDNPKLVNEKINGYKVLGQIKDASNYSDVYFVCCVGSSKIRKKIIDELIKVNSEIKFATLIDPSVDLSNLVNIGEGSIICAGTILTVNIEIGTHVIINLNSTIGHDTIVNNYVTIYPGVNLSGNCNIGELTELGTNCSIIQGISLGTNNIVGAGTVIIKSIDSGNTIVGVPGKIVK